MRHCDVMYLMYIVLILDNGKKFKIQINLSYLWLQLCLYKIW